MNLKLFFYSFFKLTQMRLIQNHIFNFPIKLNKKIDRIDTGKKNVFLLCKHMYKSADHLLILLYYSLLILCNSHRVYNYLYLSISQNWLYIHVFLDNNGMYATGDNVENVFCRKRRWMSFSHQWSYALEKVRLDWQPLDQVWSMAHTSMRVTSTDSANSIDRTRK